MVRILMVEDNDIIRGAVSDLIELNQGHVVVGQAENGRIACALLEDGLTADVIVTDLNMPEMDGIQLSQYVTDRYPDIKVIILTMHDKKTFLNRALEAGAKGYLLKNGDMEELFSTIEKVRQGETVIGPSVSSGV